MNTTGSFVSFRITVVPTSYSRGDIREEFGKGRVKVHAEFDGIPYDGSIVNMGVKDENGNVCYLIGLLKAIRKQLQKSDGDSVHVVIQERK